MPDGWTTAELKAMIARIAARMEQDVDELNALDGALGDGDLGVTMVRGMRSLMAAVQDTAPLPNLPEDVGQALLKCAQVFTKVSGSTYGTLLATGLMSAAKHTKGQTVVPWTEVSPILGEAVEAMAKRARSQLGDKTVLDAIDAVRAATAGMSNPQQMAQAAEQAVAETLGRFRDQPAKQGRARIFGEKSVGLDDPGMVAFKRMVEALQ